MSVITIFENNAFVTATLWLQTSQWNRSWITISWRIWRAALRTRSRFQVSPGQEQEYEAHHAPSGQTIKVIAVKSELDHMPTITSINWDFSAIFLSKEHSDLSLSGLIIIYVAVISVLIFGPAVIKRYRYLFLIVLTMATIYFLFPSQLNLVCSIRVEQKPWCGPAYRILETAMQCRK